MKTFFIGLATLVVVFGQDAEIFSCPKLARIPEYLYQDITALQAAVLVNSTEDIDTFIDSGCDVNYDGAFQSRVVTKCDNPLLERLGLECRREVIYSGYTALLMATLHGNIDTVRILLRVPGIDVNAGSNYSSNPLFNAAQKGDLEMVRLLVEAGADIDYKGGPDNAQISILAVAGASGDVAAVKYLISNGAKINELDNDGFSAIGAAASQGNDDVVKLLAEAGADINQVQGKYEQTLIMLALHDDNNDLIEYLIRKGVSVNAEATDGETSLFLAAQYGNLEAVKLLIDAGADVNHLNGQYKISALFRAIQKKNTDVALYLISKGADVNAKTDGDFTPAYAAAEAGDVTTLKALTAAGADLNVKGGGREWTPLMKAAFDGDVDVVKFLIDAGADLEITDVDGNTALDLAEQQFNYDIASLLREK